MLTQSDEGTSRLQVEAAVDPIRKPFRVRPIHMNLPKEWTSGSVSELLEMLEGPDYR
jgi:hypothetical protein